MLKLNIVSIHLQNTSKCVCQKEQQYNENLRSFVIPCSCFNIRLTKPINIENISQKHHFTNKVLKMKCL